MFDEIADRVPAIEPTETWIYEAVIRELADSDMPLDLTDVTFGLQFEWQEELYEQQCAFANVDPEREDEDDWNYFSDAESPVCYVVTNEDVIAEMAWVEPARVSDALDRLVDEGRCTRGSTDHGSFDNWISQLLGLSPLENWEYVLNKVVGVYEPEHWGFGEL